MEMAPAGEGRTSPEPPQLPARHLPRLFTATVAADRDKSGRKALAGVKSGRVVPPGSRERLMATGVPPGNPPRPPAKVIVGLFPSYELTESRDHGSGTAGQSARHDRGTGIGHDHEGRWPGVPGAVRPRRACSYRRGSCGHHKGFVTTAEGLVATAWGLWLPEGSRGRREGGL
jgi:hypothetical protein